jgi:hypothetical protein
MHAAEPSASASAQQIVEALVCTNAGCACFKTAKRGYGLTHCPVHDDHTPSFNVSVKADVVLIHCESGGCSQENLIEALRDRNLWPKHQPVIQSNQTIVAEYDYKDVHGNLLYQALRMGPVKTFRQRRPDGHNGWIWNLTGVDRVLYHLPDLLAADPKRLRIIVEGEKDVESLARLGFVATCNVGGAGKWLSQYSKWFAKCNVCLIPDNDTAGHNHMVQVAKSISTVAASIRWLALPDLGNKGDITDWLDNGGTIDRLKVLIKSAPLFSDELIEQPVGPVLADVVSEMYMIFTCAQLPMAITYLEPDDFTNDVYRAMFKALRAGEKVVLDGIEEPGDDYDEWTTLCKLRDLRRRRAALQVADHITSVAGDTSKIFNPCLAADALQVLCEHSHDKAESTRLSDVLDLL